ncbi:amidohydrolase family protein [Nonomuraea sp. LP-02]|uniref:amidohydrolase family protein n=1 Tax=Nonomuraea sp. LP-02 TaxID=3097960 RepID=UPI002E36A9C8|nr:amidohydrolase family protein [Nonomuraea sp. LP-02]MED7924270.1 amidohydrolase family protein [Nonomuraea sp. LP-02]
MTATDGRAPANEPVWLSGGHVVDVRSGKVRRDTNVVVQGGRIDRITAEAPPPGARTVRLGGRYLLPGLISVHTHLSVVYPFSATDEAEDSGITALRALSRARDALYAGVTTIRSVHEQNRADLLVRTAAGQGWVEAPRIVGAGRAISTTGGHGHGSACVYADGYDSFLRAARAELAAGADLIKIFITGGIAHQGESFTGAQMTIDEMRAVVRAAEEHNTYVTAHAGAGSAIREALSAGVRGYEHAYELDADTARQMAAQRVYLTPTLCVTRCPEWMAEHSFTPWQIERALEVGPGHLASIRTAIAAGVADPDDPERPGITFLAGTDYPPGEPIEDTVVAVREMEFLAEAGLSTEQALRSGTLEAARLVGLRGQAGAVEEGHLADLIVTERDPLSDLSALRRISLVMQAGRIVRDDLPAVPDIHPTEGAQ